MVDSALASVDAGVVSCPESLQFSSFVIPPRVGDAIKLERCVVAILLFFTYKWKKSDHSFHQSRRLNIKSF